MVKTNKRMLLMLKSIYYHSFVFIFASFGEKTNPSKQSLSFADTNIHYINANCVKCLNVCVCEKNSFIQTKEVVCRLHRNGCIGIAVYSHTLFCIEFAVF